MTHRCDILLTPVLVLLVSSMLDCASAATPKEEYVAIMRDYNADMGIRSARSDRERKAAVERFAQFPKRLTELAQKYPDDPIAINALRAAVQAVNTTDSIAQVAWESNETDFPKGSSDNWVTEIVAQLQRDHIRSPKLGPVIDRARYGYRPGFEPFLRAALRENPERKNRALACLALAQYLLEKSRMLQVAEDRSELEGAYANIFGKDFLPGWRGRGKAQLAKEAEELFEQAVEYEDVESRGGNVASLARMALYDIRNLSIGKAAPETEGLDQDGLRFRLSDYRGKVVLLYFWMQFCPT